MTWFWAGYLATALILGAIGNAIGRTKGRPVAGFWLGFGLGPIGLIIIAVMDRTAEQEAAHMLAVQRGGDVRPNEDFSKWLNAAAPAASRPTPRAPDRRWSDVLAEAEADSKARTLNAAVQQARSLPWAVRGPGVWFFSDGVLNFVGIVDGRTIASNASRTTELASTATVTYQPTTAGEVLSITIGSTVLTNPRPARKAREFLTRVHAQPTDPVPAPEPEPAEPTSVATQESAPSVRASLIELAALRSEGLVSEEDYTAKRAEILSRL